MSLCRDWLLSSVGAMLISAAPGLAQGASLEPAGANPAGLAQPTRQAVEMYNSGVTMLQESKYAEAADKFRQAVTISPDFVNAHFNLGTATLLQGDSAAAMPELKKAVEMNPRLGPAWATLGSCYQTCGQTAEAIESYKKYLAVSPHGDLSVKVSGLVASLTSELKRAESVNETDKNDYFHEATYGGLARWKSMPVSVYIKPATGVPGFRPELLEVLKVALSDWETASNGKVSFSYTDNPDVGQITIQFTHSLRDAVTAAEGGHTVVVPDKLGNIQTATVSLLTIPPSGTELGANYARRVDLHELGHALGILGHSTNPEDIMFASVLPNNKMVSLSPRDAGTLVMIYSDEATKMAKPGIDTSLSISGDPHSMINRVLLLNNQAKSLMEKGQFDQAMQKLEEANKIMPENEIVGANLGAMYANQGSKLAFTHQFLQAEPYFKKAIPLLEHGPNKGMLGPVLKNYSFVLHVLKMDREAAAVDARLNALAVH